MTGRTSYKVPLHYCPVHNTTTPGCCIACLANAAKGRAKPLPAKWAREVESQLTPEHEKLRDEMRRRSLEMMRTGKHVPVEE